MILVTTDHISGKELETIGLVKGATIQAKNLGRDITQAIRSIFGGELIAYTDLMNQSRETAIQRMIEDAEKLGADAIVNVRFSTASIMKGASEVFAYGTAVKFK
ncbi:MAG: YbjQ family protein [Methanosarcinales archaeon]|jgi:uncharacterized protein YbjQ (UPF0145 family)|nr:YbjQ family protein [Methanosarcinales archaeon]